MLDKKFRTIYSNNKQPVIMTYDAGCFYKRAQFPHQVFRQILP